MKLDLLLLALEKLITGAKGERKDRSEWCETITMDRRRHGRESSVSESLKTLGMNCNVSRAICH